MKELTIEQKAKAYDEAKVRMSRAWNENRCTLGFMNEIFPELKESKDEQHRKWILEYLYDGLRKSDEQFKGQFKCAIDWLESQGEQKFPIEKLPEEMKTINESLGFTTQKECDDYNKMVTDLIMSDDDKDEPKFKVGNWYQCTKDFFGKGVTFDKNAAYYCAKEGCLQDEYGCHIAIVKDLYDNFKLWNLEDAKDGDVLYFNDNTIVIFKDLYNATTFHSYCHIEDGVFDISKDDMPDWWEGKGFHPATKEQRDLLFSRMHEAGYMWDSDKKELKKIKQKSWSGEDGRMVETIISHLERQKNYQTNTTNIEQCQNWLKFLKERLQPQPKQEWSENDEKMLNDIISDVKFEGYNNDMLANSYKKINWLKSLKPQKQWKPSDEQMEALWNILHPDDPYYVDLSSLYNDLKKLKEE